MIQLALVFESPFVKLSQDFSCILIIRCSIHNTRANIDIDFIYMLTRSSKFRGLKRRQESLFIQAFWKDVVLRVRPFPYRPQVSLFIY